MKVSLFLFEILSFKVIVNHREGMVMNYFNTGMYAMELYGYTATKTVNTQKTQVAKTNNRSFSDTIKKAEQKESVVDK